MEGRYRGMSDSPPEAEELSVDWLTMALRNGGVLRRASVTSLSVTDLGRGMTSRVARVELTYNLLEHGAPGSVIVKIPIPHTLVGKLALHFRLYEREALFYRQLAPLVSLPTPRHYFSSDRGKGEYVLLLEDMLPAQEGDLAGGCRPDVAEDILLRLARMHAAWWDSSELKRLDWLPVRKDLARKVFRGPLSPQESWKAFFKLHKDHLPRSVLRIGDRLKDDLSILDGLSANPRTLVHGDTRINNMHFTGSDLTELRAVGDWQGTAQAKGVCDVACLLVNCLPQEVRKEVEAQLVPAYHRALEANGVSGYSLDECWLDYRLEVVRELNQVVAWSTLNLSPDKSAANAAAGRLFTAVDELDLLDLFPHRSRLSIGMGLRKKPYGF